MLRRSVLGVLLLALCLFGVVAPAPAPAPARAAASAYTVPTANAGLGRIVTHPNGNMWFVEKDARKIGVVQPNGEVFDFETGGSGQVLDLDVDANGVLWILINQGRDVMRYDPAAPATAASRVGPPEPSASNTRFIHLGDSPGGKRIRISPSGKPWITWNYDTQKLISIDPVSLQPSTPSNSAACGPNLSMSSGDLWCHAYSPGADIIKIAPGGNGFTQFPQSGAGRDVYSLSSGPVGSVWYTRHASGTMTSSPWLGGVGYLNAATGVYREFNTGARTAPESLVQQGGTMWFTSVGAAKGVGHLDANGRGALTQVGGYRPTALTIGSDGAVWFTDATTNVIVRVPMTELQATNVDPGAGSVFTPAPPAIVKKTPGLSVRGPSRVKRGKTAAFTVRVSASGVSPTGKVTVKVAGKKKTVALAHGKATVRIKISRHAKPGKKKVLTSYSGSTHLKARSKTTHIRVRR